MGMAVESAKRETKEWTQSISHRRPDGDLPIEIKVESLHTDYTLAGGIKLTFDSKAAETKIDSAELVFLRDLFRLESTIQYQLLLDAALKVKAIEGTAKLREKADGFKSSVAREEFLKEVGDDRLKTLFGQQIQALSEAPLNDKQPWERSELLEINGSVFTVRQKYEYRGSEKKEKTTLEKIAFKVLDVKYEDDPANKLPLRMVKPKLTVESSDGTILFDREAGAIASRNLRLRIKGDMTYSAAGVEQTGALEFTLDASTQRLAQVK
jgi:hypothetical protein